MILSSHSPLHLDLQTGTEKCLPLCEICNWASSSNSLLIFEEVKITALVSVKLSTDRASHHHILVDFLITPSKVSILPIS